MIESILLFMAQFLMLSSVFLYIIMKYHKVLVSIDRYNSNVLDHYIKASRENKEAIEKLRSEIQNLSKEQSKKTLI